MSAALRRRRRGQAQRERLGRPRTAGAVPPGGADGGRRFAVGGVAVQFWGGL